MKAKSTVKLCMVWVGVIAVAGFMASASYIIGRMMAEPERLVSRLNDIPKHTTQYLHVSTELRRTYVHDRNHAVSGQYTIIYYHQDGCQDCVRLDQDLGPFLAKRKDVAVRKIKLGKKWSSETVHQEHGRKNVWWTPFIVIYGPDGLELKADSGSNRSGSKFLRQWMESELQG